MRARASIDRIGRGSQERDAVIVTELPFQVNKARLIERIAELANEKKLEGIAEVRDESDRHGMRIVVELKRDAVPQVVQNKLFKLTPMQSSFGVIIWPRLKATRGCQSKRIWSTHDFRRECAPAHRIESATPARVNFWKVTRRLMRWIIVSDRNSRSVDEQAVADRN